MVKTRANGTKNYRTNENSEDCAPDLATVTDENVLDLLRDLSHIAPGSPKERSFQRRINQMQNGTYVDAQRLLLSLTVNLRERGTNRSF